jgi:hypothetical protein
MGGRIIAGAWLRQDPNEEILIGAARFRTSLGSLRNLNDARGNWAFDPTYASSPNCENGAKLTKTEFIYPNGSLHYSGSPILIRIAL